ncbi:MAG: hypothetical protein HKN29_09620 [Rhodothermales bacterium]|nr:hypothetical protein [Rhodothermales bacterium]
MTMKTTTTGLLTIALLTMTAGCVFEEGIGPVGPQGPPGNANVFSLNFDFLLADAAINGYVASVQYDVPDINTGVVQEGAVLLFFRDQGTWTAMPYTFYTDDGDAVSMGFGYDVGFMEVFYETAFTDPALLPDREMKAVIIDGFTAFKAGIDLTDYNAVAEYFGLEG